MAFIYSKIGFLDWIDNEPDAYLVDGTKKTIIKDNTGVTQQGTLINATAMNHIEEGILTNSYNIDNNARKIINIEQTLAGLVTIDALNQIKQDIENKKMDKSGGQFTGIVKAQSNTQYTTAQLRNLILSPNDANVNAMQNGDIWIKYK